MRILHYLLEYNYNVRHWVEHHPITLYFTLLFFCMHSYHFMEYALPFKTTNPENCIRNCNRTEYCQNIVALKKTEVTPNIL